jgi:hypothetical protein
MTPSNVIEWNGWRYSVKPFTPRTYFELSEKIYSEGQQGLIFSGTNRVGIETLLVPLDNPSSKALHSGMLVDSLYDAGEDTQAAAFEVLRAVGFLSNSYVERGQALLKEQKDLNKDILQTPKPSKSESPTNTETAPGSSGPAEAT